MRCSIVHRPKRCVPSFATSSGSRERTWGGWLIFDAPEADLGVHPNENGEPASGTTEISFYCDDIALPVAELRSRGVEFTQEVEDHGYGLVTYFKVPGDFNVQLYQPRYAK